MKNKFTHVGGADETWLSNFSCVFSASLPKIFPLKFAHTCCEKKKKNKNFEEHYWRFNDVDGEF